LQLPHLEYSFISLKPKYLWPNHLLYRYQGNLSERKFTMGALDLAKEIELKSKAHYIKQAEQGPGQLKGIFQVLANEEQHHYDLFCSIEAGKSDIELDGQELQEKAKNVFDKIARNFSRYDPIADAESAYRKAYNFEKEAISYYQTLLGVNTDPDEKKILEFIINQEKIHARLMDSLILLAQSPKIWLENAEWNHLDDAY
jgi:rubrerythrin